MFKLFAFLARKPGLSPQFDVVAERVFADRSAFDAWLGALLATDVAACVREDEERFVDHSHYFAYAVEEHVTSNQQ